jgi:uncharacterized protein
VPATIARTGVQVYDGHTEYRPPEEVFAAASLETLPSIPVTRGHPSEPVTPTVWSKMARGHVSERGGERTKLDSSAAEWIRADLIISDADMIVEVERGDALEVSAGYSCELDFTPGVSPSGEKYDAVQRNIRFNHLAVLGPGERARAGAEARLRLDQQHNTQENHQVVKIVIDGVEFEKGSDAHIAAVQAADKRKHDAAVAAKDSELAAQKARADKAEGELVVARKEATDAKDLVSPDKLDSLVAARFDLLKRAAKLLPATYDTAGKTDAQVRADAVATKFDAAKLAGKSVEYVAAMFDALTDEKAPAQYQGSVPGTTPRADGAPALKLDNDDDFRTYLAKQAKKEAE